MAINLLLSGLNPRVPGRFDTVIGSLELDATISEDQNYTNKVTTFPVEDGSPIVDHISRDSDRVTINGFVSNSPVKNIITRTGGILAGAAQDATGFTGAAGGAKAVLTNAVKQGRQELKEIGNTVKGSRPQNAFEQLMQINDEKVLVTVVTGLKIYTDMLIESISITRNHGTSSSLFFTASFINIRKASTSNVAIEDVPALAEAERNIAEKNQNAGTQPPTETSEKNASLAIGIGKGIGVIE